MGALGTLSVSFAMPVALAVAGIVSVGIPVIKAVVAAAVGKTRECFGPIRGCFGKVCGWFGQG